MISLLIKLFVKDYKDVDNPLVKKRYGFLGSFFGLISNLLIVIIKIIFGILTSTISIIADSLNNISDFGNNLISILGFKYASKKADNDHPYGHQRLEYIISLILGVIIVMLGLYLLYDGGISFYKFIISMIETGKPEIVTYKNNIVFILTLVFLGISVLIKLFQSYLYYSLSKKISSMQLKALSKDSRNDVIATIFVIIGILISYFTTYNLDCFFTISVSIFVIISGINIIKEAVVVLIGQKPSEDLIKKIKDIIDLHKDILGAHDLYIHNYGNINYGSVDIEIDDSTNLIDAHQIADNIEKEIFNKLSIKMSVHLDPINTTDSKLNNLKSNILKIVCNKNKDILIHDFHLNNKNKILSFDLVLPTIFNTKENKKEITNDVNNYLLDNNLDYKLDITFDDEIITLFK